MPTCAICTRQNPAGEEHVLFPTRHALHVDELGERLVVELELPPLFSFVYG